MYKIIQITLPNDETITEKLLKYTPDEINFILEVGINCYERGRTDIANMTETDLIKKIKDDYNNKMEKMEKQIINEKECRSYIIESLKKIYDEEKNNLILKNEKLENELNIKKKEEEILKKQEEETKISIQKEVDKALNVYKEHMNMVIDEKNKIIEKKENEIIRDREFREKYREDNTKMLQLLEGKNNYSSLKEKGNAGETIFNELSDDAFGEIEGYELKNTSTTKHSGDFHLHFKDFGILVDLKNYDTIVPLKEVIKIENDFKKNIHLKFAWLISLNTRIQNNDKGIFTYKIIDDGRCIFYVNELLKQTNQIRVIKSLYYFCKTINVFIKDNITNDEANDEYEINILKKNYKEIMEEITIIKKDICELNSTINTTKTISDRLQMKINNILKREIENIMNETKHSDLFDEWFYKSYEPCENNEPLKSRELWIKFKKDNPTIDDLDMDKFKELICDNIPKNNLIIPKNKKSSFEIINYKEKKNKTVKKQTDEFTKTQKKNEYFSIEEQEKILNLYCNEEKDIMEIKDIICIQNSEIYKIVSFLILSDVISSRTEARGYEKYKETEEYKNKIITTNNIIIIDNKKI